jgi:hypothetical protein
MSMFWGFFYCCCELLRLFLLNWNETTWLISLLLSLSSYWEDPSQQSVSSSSVFNYVMLIAGKFYGMRLLQSFNVFYGFRKGLYFIENCYSSFFCSLKLYMLWYSMSSWNQKCIVCWKDILIFMTVLSLPVNHEHWTVLHLLWLPYNQYFTLSLWPSCSG